MKISESGKNKYSETKRIIRNAISEKQLVLFVGAGASVDAGMPLWKDSVLQIKEKLNLTEKDKTDYLIIPQYYYNARGRKEYTQLMREIFHYNDVLYPGVVHDLIIRFGAETIITTNYDHLIEQAGENNGEFLYVISQDSDLSYRKAGKVLVKMHGDFEHDNFVLKEDDYLHYHKNFKLIENYIKSLIGTKTILFVGYSFGDPDVKHIFSWVKEILDEHFQRAYLISTCKEANQNEIEYYRHLGVNIIYSTELFEAEELHNNTHTEQLIHTLQFLLDDEEKQKGIIESLYNYLKPFALLNYTYKNYIESSFYRLKNKLNNKITLRLNTNNYIEFFDSQAIDEEKEFLIELAKAIDGKSDNPKMQVIFEVLKKSIARGTSYNINDETDKEQFSKEFPKIVSNPEWIDAIISFDYRKLYQIKDSNSKVLTDSNPELYLQQAYICAILGDYLTAYYCLDNATTFYYRKKEFAWYFISLWNKKHIAQIISSDYICQFTIPNDIRETIKNDYNNINIEKTLQTIPDLGNDNNRFLRDLKDFKFASDLFYDVVSNSFKSKKQAKETYIMFAGMPAYEEIRQQVYDYYRYGIYNYLMVDRYRENNEIFYLFAHSIFASASAPDKNISSELIFENTGNIHIDYLNAIDIHLILRYIESRKLRQLFNEFSIHTLEINESGKNYLMELIHHVSNLFNSDISQQRELFWRFLCFISHVEMHEEMASTILSILSGIRENEYVDNKRDLLIEFVKAIYDQRLYSSKTMCNNAKALINRLIDLIIKTPSDLTFFMTSITILIAFCNKGNCLFDNKDSITELLSEDYYILLARIYNECADNVKAIIKDLFDQWKCPNSISGYEVYSEIVLAGIIEPNSEIENKAFDYLVKQKKEIQKQKNQGLLIDYKDNLERDLINLFLAGQLLDKDKFKNIVLNGNDNFSKWLIDLDGYDYKEFDISWLKLCYPSLLKKLSENKNIRESILAVYKKQYTPNYIDKKTNEIIVQYFI